MVATVMFGYDQLSKDKSLLREEDVLCEVLAWKKHWTGEKEDELKDTIRHLAIPKWITLQIDFDQDDDF